MLRSRSTKSKAFVLLAVLFSPVLAKGQVIHLDAVKRSTIAHYPKVAEARQKAVLARGKTKESKGAFDLNVVGKAEVRPQGYYDNEQYKAVLEQPTPYWGTKLYGGWRWSEGAFPSYEGKRVTGSGGEFVAGLRVPVLRGGAVDSARTKIATAKAGQTEADAGVRLTELDALLDASLKYWKWVEAVNRLRIYVTLLEAAETRQQWLTTRVRLGDVPRFEAVDNERTILDRRTRVVRSTQEVAQTALDLSLYLRNEKGEPIVATAEQAPGTFPEPVTHTQEEAKGLLEAALSRRPELKALEAREESVLASRDLASNRLLPTLDVFGEVAEDRGAVDVTRRGTEIRAGLEFRLPLQRREARGQLAQASADQRRLRQARRLLVDGTYVQVRQALAALQATYEQAQLARKEVSLNETLVAGENERFKQGASHILFVNLRELSLGESRAGLVKALSLHQQAIAELNRATGSLD